MKVKTDIKAGGIFTPFRDLGNTVANPSTWW